MMIPTFPLNPEIARSGPIYRAARLALLQHELMLSFEDTDTAAEKVERAVAKLAKASTRAEQTVRHLPYHSPCPPGHRRQYSRS
ncbi:MAG: hypothetical protein ABIQ51_08355 [Mesorhizobium sp.]